MNPGELKPTDLPPAFSALTHVRELVRTYSMSPERAVLEAVMTRDDLWLTELLGRFECNLSDAMMCSARNGYNLAAKPILSKMLGTVSNSVKNDDDTQEILRGAIKTATINGHLSIIRLLLPKFDFDRSREVAWSVVYDAAAGGQLHILEFAVMWAGAASLDEPWTNPTRPVLAAISGRHTQVVMFLIHRYYLKWNFYEAFEKALANDMVSIAEYICDLYRAATGSTTILENMFVYLAWGGFSLATQYFYHDGYDSPELIQEAFIGAAKYDQVDVLRFLLSTKQLSPTGYLNAFETAARAGSDTTVKFLYQNKQLTLKAIEKAFENSGSATISKFLYDKLRNPAKAAISAFLTTVAADLKLDDGYLSKPMENRFKLLQFLCSTGHIPTEFIVHAYLNSSHTDVLQALYREDCITRDVTLQAFQGALKSRDSHVIWETKILLHAIKCCGYHKRCYDKKGMSDSKNID